MRRMRKQPVAQLNQWDWDREPGDRVFRPMNKSEYAAIYDLVESNGRHKSAAGELTPRLVKKRGKPRRAAMDDVGVWHWID